MADVNDVSSRGGPGGASDGRQWTVRTYLILIMVTGVIAVVAAIGLGFISAAQTAQAAATADMALLADRAADATAANTATAIRTVQQLAEQPGIEGVLAAPEGCTLTVDGTATFPSVRVDIVAADGRVVCSSQASLRVTATAVHAGSDWLTRTLRAAGTTVSWDALDAVTGRPSFAAAVAIGPPDAPTGAIVSFLHVDVAAPAMARGYAVDEETSFMVANRSSGAVLSSSLGAPQHTVGRDGSPAVPTDLDGDFTAADGSRHLMASQTVRASRWTVTAAIPRATVLAAARTTLWRQALLGLIALTLLGLATVILNRRIAQPLRALTDAVVLAGTDPSSRSVPSQGTAELMTLAHEINTMLDIRAGHEAQMRHQTTHDPLTGLPNDVLVRERLAEMLDGPTMQSGMAVLAIGIDRFKVINDSRGHEAGNRILRQVAGRLSAALRPDDTLARSSGDVFLMLCHNAGLDDAVQIAERLLRCFDRPFEVTGTDINIRASIGIAVADRATTTPDQVLREVDSALHHAKQSGVSSCVFDQSLQSIATQHLEVERDLGLALQRGELFVQYQPLVDIATGTIVGAEALVRWQHPKRGLVPPMDFIPIAEDTGQIVAIGRFVLTQACRQAAAWTAAGHPMRMSVNVATSQLQKDDLPSVVAQVLSDTGLAAHQLCLEITESSLMTAPAQSSHDLARLRALGVHVAIDDFGTGYSSLAYLHELPVDQLKIDRSFINRIGTGNGDTHLLAAIMGMARALDLTVVAEGVETNEQLDKLSELLCDLAQGYLLAKPLPPDEFLTRLNTGSTLIKA